MEVVFRRPPLVAFVALALAVAACGSGDGTDTGGSVPEPTAVPTIGGVGVLPDVASDREQIMIRPPLNEDGTEAELIGEQVEGNRILLIGDSILAGTSRRYSNNMCNVLVPLGWEVDVEAEPSRFIDFGNRVLDRVLPDDVDPDDDYDAAVVFLGSNYGNDEVVYEAELREILDRLSPRPTLLLTVTEYRPYYSEVNEVVRRLADEYANVTLVDWESVARTPGVLSGDRLHPTNQGRQVLAELIAASLGQVAVGDGECLDASFTDDSQASSDSGLGSSSSSNSSSSSSGGGSSSGGSWSTTTVLAPTTTVAPVTTTTVPAPAPAPAPTTTNAPVPPTAAPTPTVPAGDGSGDGAGDGAGGAGGEADGGDDASSPTG